MSAPAKQKVKKKVTKLGLSVSKAEDFPQWYTEVITKSEMISYYEDVSGCYILRPLSYKIWESIQGFFDKEIKELGVEPCYFPMFVSERALNMEKDHIEDFAPEVAWVTKSGGTDMDNPLAIRPTSETIMYPAFASWIHSHRDLPLRLNQWTNVVRWEFKNPTPFLRTREFLWQEGHSAFANKEEADVEVLQILDLYARVYEELLAVSVIKGRKSDKEKFAGGDYTTTVEAYIPGAGRAIQGATSHGLGQNFSKMFNITYESEKGEKGVRVWQNSWGLTTRTIGVGVMVHSDDKGLVLPPRVAPTQAVVVFILYKGTSEVNDDIIQMSTDISKTLKDAGVRVKLDDRRDKNPGWKYAHYEQRGVPLRVEVGQKDLENKSCMIARRDTGEKISVAVSDLASIVPALLEQVQADMLAKARRERDENLTIAWNWKEFCDGVEQGHLVLAPWSLTTESEEWVKDETKRMGEEKQAELKAMKKGGKGKAEGEKKEDDGKSLTGAAKTLCIPFNQPDLPEGTMCFTGNGLPAKEWCLWGRSY